MNAEEAAQLCRIAKSISPSQPVDEFTPAAWALILERVRFEDAKEALRQLGGEQEWLHVSHIVKRVKRIRSARVTEHYGSFQPPAGLSDAEYGRWMDETIEAIADGRLTRDMAPPPPPGVSRRDVAELGQAGRANEIPSAEIRTNADRLRAEARAGKAERTEKPEPEPLPDNRPKCQSCGHVFVPVRRGECARCGSDAGPDLPPEDRVGGDETSDEEVAVG